MKWILIGLIIILIIAGGMFGVQVGQVKNLQSEKETLQKEVERSQGEKEALQKDSGKLRSEKEILQKEVDRLAKEKQPPYGPKITAEIDASLLRSLLKDQGVSYVFLGDKKYATTTLKEWERFLDYADKQMVVSIGDSEIYDCDDRVVVFAGLASRSGDWSKLGDLIVYDYQNNHAYNLLLVSEDGQKIDLYQFDFELGLGPGRHVLKKAKLNTSCVVFGG